jgi:uncharacterized protein (UPF0297 family)
MATYKFPNCELQGNKSGRVRNFCKKSRGFADSHRIYFPEKEVMAVNQDEKRNMDETIMFRTKNEDNSPPRQVLEAVYQALTEKGYHPVNQIVGYLLSGDPAYITSHQNARALIRKLDRDDLLEELVRSYLEIEE